jgi:hypothetical protein
MYEDTEEETVSYTKADSTTLERSETMVKLTCTKETTYEVKFSDLTGDVLDIISEYLPYSERVPPLFVLCNSSLLKNYAEYKRENYTI